MIISVHKHYEQSKQQLTNQAPTSFDTHEAQSIGGTGTNGDSGQKC
jgi:hypothetical protein